MAETKSFLRACKDHFGYGVGGDLKSFSQELKALTPQDRVDMTEGFKAIGIEIVDPSSAAAPAAS